MRSTLRSLRALVIALAPGFIAGCGASGCGASSSTAPEPTTTTTTNTTTGATSIEAVPAAGIASPYEVHEWGLVDVLEGGSIELAAGAGAVPPSHMSVRKPVLYFHLPEGSESLAVDVRARIIEGSVYETYPPDARPSPDTAHWAATLSRTHCNTSGSEPAGDRSARLPVRACDTPDGICEVTELPRYDAASAACVTVGSVSAGMLFYRGMLSPTLPLEVTRLADMTVRVTARASMGGAPGQIIRISTALSGPWEPGHVVLSRAAFPAPGASVDMAVGTEVLVRSTERQTLAVALGELGLDADETEAFLNAWMEGLFGLDAPAREAAGAPPMPQDAVIYFLPEPLVEGLSHLELSPAPGRIRRAFMVRVILPGVDTA